MSEQTKPPLDPAALDELERLLRKSTHGTWKTWALTVMADTVGDSNVATATAVARGVGPRTFDIDLICAMHRSLPSLIAAARELAVLKAAPSQPAESPAKCQYCAGTGRDDAFTSEALAQAARDDERFQAGFRAGANSVRLSAGQALGLVVAQTKVLDLHQECGDHYCEFHSGKEEEFAHECSTCDSIDRLRAAKSELGELLLTLEPTNGR